MTSFESKRDYIILDRIDIQVEIKPVEFEVMANKAPGEGSEAIRKRELLARAGQQERYRNLKGVYCNAQMNSKLLHEFAWPDEEGMKKLKERMTRLNMSACAFDRILRVARTIADLDYATRVDGDGTHLYSTAEIADMPILVSHLSEAIGYRSLDRASYGSTF